MKPKGLFYNQGLVAALSRKFWALQEGVKKSWIKQKFLRKNLFVKVYKRILKFARKCPEGLQDIRMKSRIHQIHSFNLFKVLQLDEKLRRNF